MKRSRVLVVGAGVVGAVVALRLQGEGAQVVLADGAEDAPNASTVAAGMLAPASEAAFGETEHGRLPLLRAARALWPDAAGGAVRFQRDGALIIDDDAPALATARDAFKREGVVFSEHGPEAARRLQPLLSERVGDVLHTSEDWRLEPTESLAQLLGLFAAANGERRRAEVAAAELPGAWDAVVLCAGWASRRFASRAPELDHLRPVKGQLIRFPGAPPHDGPVVRWGGVYLAPSRRGIVAGASMEEGRDDLTESPEVTASLAKVAREAFPHLAGIEPEAAVGIRAATPDGLPLVGRSTSGLHLATGFRRNGWLLAPLAARIVADQLAGRDPGPWAGPLDPRRFANPART